MLILVTNDDGILSPGISVLAEHLQSLGDVRVVAPDRERSAAGHSLTLHAPLRAEQIRPGWFAVDGTPTDCVNLGIHGLIQQVPELVVSGINRGANLGDDVTYSGTVSAAMEATLMGVQALAVSLSSGPYEPEDFKAAARITARLAAILLKRRLPKDTFLNVNIPRGEPSRIAITRQGRRRYEDLVVEKTDPRGRKYYWIGGNDLGFENDPGTDCAAVSAGQVSVTPLHLDLTNYGSMDSLRDWSLESLLPLDV